MPRLASVTVSKISQSDSVLQRLQRIWHSGLPKSSRLPNTTCEASDTCINTRGLVRGGLVPGKRSGVMESIAAAGQWFTLFGFCVDKRVAVNAALDGLWLLLWHRRCGGAHGVGSIEKAHARWAWFWFDAHAGSWQSHGRLILICMSWIGTIRLACAQNRWCGMCSVAGMPAAFMAEKRGSISSK